MKKLLLFLLLSIVFIACGYNRGSNLDYSVITSIDATGQYCRYYCTSDEYSASWYNFMFVDSARKFQVGDTIKIVKK